MAAPPASHGECGTDDKSLNKNQVSGTVSGPARLRLWFKYHKEQRMRSNRGHRFLVIDLFCISDPRVHLVRVRFLCRIDCAWSQKHFEKHYVPQISQYVCSGPGGGEEVRTGESLPPSLLTSGNSSTDRHCNNCIILAVKPCGTTMLWCRKVGTCNQQVMFTCDWIARRFLRRDPQGWTHWNRIWTVCSCHISDRDPPQNGTAFSGWFIVQKSMPRNTYIA